MFQTNGQATTNDPSASRVLFHVCMYVRSKLLRSAVRTDLKCGPFPGPGSGSERRVSMNPIHEFIHHDDDHVEDAFSRFKKTHSKNYRDQATHERRKHNFRQNLRSVTLGTCRSSLLCILCVFISYCIVVVLL